MPSPEYRDAADSMAQAFLAQRDSAANQWLRDNPIALVVLFAVLGLALCYFGFVGLQRGHTTSKGFQVRGAANTFVSIIRILAGFGCIVAAMWFGVDAFR